MNTRQYAELQICSRERTELLLMILRHNTKLSYHTQGSEQEYFEYKESSLFVRNKIGCL